MSASSKLRNVGPGGLAKRLDGGFVAKKAFIFANGEISDHPAIHAALAAHPDALIIAADGGAKVARYFGCKIDRVIGDMDSLSEELLTTLSAEGVILDRYPAEKDETDLELALRYAVLTEEIPWIRLIAWAGGRLDHTLSNIYLLALPYLRGCDVAMLNEDEEVRLLTPGEHRLNGSVGETVSLIPLSDTVEGIVTEGLFYPLKNEDLIIGPARGMSNVISAPEASLSFEKGLLLLTHHAGQR